MIKLELSGSEEAKNENKAGYTAALVACGWAGAVFELLERSGKCSEAKDHKNIKKVKWGPTNRPTDRQTKWGVESRSTQLKKTKKKEKWRKKRRKRKY